MCRGAAHSASRARRNSPRCCRRTDRVFLSVWVKSAANTPLQHSNSRCFQPNLAPQAVARMRNQTKRRSRGGAAFNGGAPGTRVNGKHQRSEKEDIFLLYVLNSCKHPCCCEIQKRREALAMPISPSVTVIKVGGALVKRILSSGSAFAGGDQLPLLPFKG